MLDWRGVLGDNSGVVLHVECVENLAVFLRK